MITGMKPRFLRSVIVIIAESMKVIAHVRSLILIMSNNSTLRYGTSLRYKEKSKLIEKIKSLPIYNGGYLVNIGHFKDWVIQIIKTGTADVLEYYIIEGGKIVRKK